MFADRFRSYWPRPASAGDFFNGLLEPFLLLLSSVFVPLFGVILGRLAFGTHAPTLLAQARVVNALPVALWLAGIAVYHLAPKVLPGAGSALPALAFSFALAWATRPKAR